MKPHKPHPVFSAFILDVMRSGDRKDAWLLNDLARGRYGRKRKHISSRRVLNAMREGDRVDAWLMAYYTDPFYRS